MVEKEGHSVQETAEYFECSTSTVYAALRYAKGRKGPPMIKKGPPAPVVLGLRLAEVEATEVILRSAGDTLLGTLTIQAGGLSFRRANQKGRNGPLSWETLERVLQLGL
jgi:hypothetical protein